MPKTFFATLHRPTLLSILALVTLSVIPPAESQKARKSSMDNPAVESIRKMKSAVVQIAFRAQISERTVSGVAGTGFLVAAGPYVITNNHVIMVQEELSRAGATNIHLTVGLCIPDQVVGAGIDFKANFVHVGFDVVDVDSPHDIALLKLKKNPFKGEVRTGFVVDKKELPLEVSVAKLRPEMPPEGTALLISGYPLRIPTMVTQSGIVASQSFQMVEKEVPGERGWFKMPEVADALLIDANVNPGNSGGPVYTPDSGEVIGICQATVRSPIQFENGEPVKAIRGDSQEPLMQNAGIAVVIPIRYAIVLLDKHKLTTAR